MPNCEQCHDCYFQWFDIISNFTVRVDALQAQIQELLATYYNGHTAESLSGEVEELLTQLNDVNDTLNLVTLREGDVEELERSLQMVGCVCHESELTTGICIH